MPEPIAADAHWRYDYIPEYNLDETIINRFLVDKWGNYQFFIEVSVCDKADSPPFENK